MSLLPPSASCKDIIGSCLICGEPSTGRHYGILACLGCKTFFRRAVVQRQDTVCRRGNACAIDAADCARKACRACRYKKCLEMGMTKEALQPRRDLIGRRRIMRPVSPESPPTAIRNDLLELMNRLTAMDVHLRKRKFDLIRAKQEAVKLHEQMNIGSEDPNTKTYDRSMSICLNQDISYCTYMEVLQMIQWTTSIPCFSSLPSADKLVLLKRFSMYNLILEHGYYTSQLDVDDIWLVSNGSCLPRTVNALPEESKVSVSADRKWRQEKLYKQMTDICIDEVACPFRRLGLTPEELVVLKIIMLFQGGSHISTGEGFQMSDETHRVVVQFRNKVISALFTHYERVRYEDYPERFGNVLLTLSGIATAAAATQESYQVMRLFKFVQFDRLCEQILFNA